MAPVLVVIASYGFSALTHAVTGDLAREADLADVLVVDNQGDYEAVGDERVVRPGSNLGWLRACNLGLERARDEGYDHALLLNNDTRLSPGFVAGLLDAHAATGALLAPVYDDDAFAGQAVEFSGSAADYVPAPVERPVTVVDGTAMLVPHAHAETLGPLDARRFGRHGWGAVEDWALLARQRSVPIAVTERAYVSHPRAATADAVNPRYSHFANAEMHYGLARKWGRNWPLALPGSGHEPITPGYLATCAAWHGVEVSGLARLLPSPAP